MLEDELLMNIYENEENCRTFHVKGSRKESEMMSELSSAIDSQAAEEESVSTPASNTQRKRKTSLLDLFCIRPISKSIKDSQRKQSDATDKGCSSPIKISTK